ncbi:MAG: hypothetical protein HYZ21_09635 [Chloroflexi bacterium]|nr:hypothetical protein [Chloroflexota bacterium]
MIPVIYYGVTSRLKYGKQLLNAFSLFANLKSMKFKTRFAKLDEFYKAINELIKWLKKDGHLEESQKLGTAMVAGATGSEILGDITLALKSMNGKYSPELRKEINECFEFALNHRKILGLAGR